MWNALPSSMRSRNSSRAELYLLSGAGDGLRQMDAASIAARSVVSTFSYHLGTGVERRVVDRDPSAFMTHRDRFLCYCLLLIGLVAPGVAIFVTARLVAKERREFIAESGARLWPHLMLADAAKAGAAAPKTLSERDRSTTKARAKRIVARSMKLFPTIDAVCDLGRRGGTLLECVQVAAAHSTVLVATQLPTLLVGVALLLMDDRQETCFYSDMVRGRCDRVTASALTTALLSVSLAGTVLSILLQILEYLCNHIDGFVMPSAGSRISRTRLTLFRWRAWRGYQVLAIVMFAAQCFILCAAAALIASLSLLGAIAFPFKYVPVLLAVGSVVIVAKTTWQTLKSAQQSIRSELGKLKGVVEDSDDHLRAVREVLSSAGCSEAQIIAVTIASVVCAIALFGFILGGLSLFVASGDLATTVISSGAILSAALVSARAGGAAAPERMSYFSAFEGYSEAAKRVESKIVQAEASLKVSIGTAEGLVAVGVGNPGGAPPALE